MTKSKSLVIIGLLLLVSPVQADTISGVVKDRQTLLPIHGARVTLLKQRISKTTDSQGRFALSGNTSDTLIIAGNKYWENKVPVTSSNASNLDIKLQAAKHRLVITTDIGGGDPDDLQSMVHAILLSNEFDLEGIISGHAWGEANIGRGIDRIKSVIDAYEKVLPNLKVHADGYPSPDYLRSIVRQGQARARMGGTGEGEDSPGSELIISAVDRDDPRPVWLNAWGGANTIAQAYWKVKNTRTPEEIKQFVNKVRVYDILGQCDSGSWIAKNFPDAFYVRNGQQGVYGWAPSKGWSKEHVQSHGPMGRVYPTSRWATEGDSPAFFHISSRGLNDPDEIAQGGWGGRHGPEKKTGVPLFSWAQKNAICNAHDKKLRPYYIYTNTSEGCDSISKWKHDIYNSQAARMDWTMTSKRSEANHFPLAVLNGDTTRQILDMPVKPGKQVTLDASGSNDPDGDTLQYSWQFYNEASSYHGSVSIEDGDSSAAKITIPANATGKSIHIILVIHDDGSPRLHAYRRMILNVK